MGKVLLVILIIFFLVVLGGLFVVRGVVEEMEKQGLNFSGFEELNGAKDSGNIQDPHDLYPDYSDNDSTPLPDNLSNDITTKEATEAYKKYLAAYNKLSDLMAQGKGDTLEADQAYQDYLEAKENYEQIAKELK